MNIKDFFEGKIVDGMTQKLVGSALRWVLTGTGFIIAGHGDDGNVEQLAGALVAAGTLLWSMYEKRQERKEKLTALAMAKVSENTVKSLVANPDLKTPDVTSHPDAVPCPVVEKPPTAA